MAALEERLEFLENGTSSMSSSCLIELSHFERALSKVKPSVSEQRRKHYEVLVLSVSIGSCQRRATFWRFWRIISVEVGGCRHGEWNDDAVLMLQSNRSGLAVLS
uniref:Uncharacterized protein n=1 Tax=Setaria viridis TaxID=4556 RepID=A0A4U6W1H6_SETVI|nr:hypothetical protein SEVIR_2G428100v2 [Setaria viridis]